LTLAGIAALFLGIKWWYPEHLGLVFGAVVAFYALLYIAGGGRVPWRIKFRDYLVYVAISLAIVGMVLLFAVYQAHKTR